MDSEMKMMFNTILEEMGRIEDRTNQHFNELENRLESIQHEVSACRLERESISLLIKKIDPLERRIEELEKKTA